MSWSPSATPVQPVGKPVVNLNYVVQMNTIVLLTADSQVFSHPLISVGWMRTGDIRLIGDCSPKISFEGLKMNALPTAPWPDAEGSPKQ